METGEAPNALNIEVQSGLGGTRILNPLKSSGSVRAAHTSTLIEALANLAET